MSSSSFKNKFALRLSSVLILLSFAFSFLPPAARAQTAPEKTRELTPEDKPVKEQKRLALVIGNAKYEHTSGLKNAANDAADISAALRELGFEVMGGTDQSQRQMEKLIQEFGDKLMRQNGVGLFFYAGHGVQYKNKNYLIPVNAEILSEADIPYESVDIGRLMARIEQANNDLNILFLDACRNNPFAKNWSEYRGAEEDNTLGKVSAPKGTILIYATEPGKVASDGAGRNGLFTEALLEQIKKPDLELDAMYKMVAKKVAVKSKQTQLPYKEGTNYNDFYFAVTPSQLKTPGEPKALNESKSVSEPKISSEAKTTESKLPPEQKTSDESKTSSEIKTPGEQKTSSEPKLSPEPTASNESKILNEAKGDESKTSGESKTTADTVVKPIENAPQSGKTRFVREAEAWSAVSGSADAQELRAFLEIFPNGANAENAKIRLEQVLWDARRKTKNKASIQEHLKEFPNGENAPVARILLRDLERQEKEKLNAEASSEETVSREPVSEETKLKSISPGTVGARKINPANKKIAARTNAAEMEFVFIPAGSFMMGASAANIDQTRTIARKDYADFDQSQLVNEKPVRRVTFAEGFWMGKFEVTQAQWTAVMGDNPSFFKGCDDCPVERVSWEKAKIFLRKLNELDDGYVYRLPSEAEWEYAARAGTVGIFSGPIEQMSWHSGNSEDKTHPVGAKLPNPFGLYDIYGNVSEWCEDIYSPTYEGLPVDGSPNTAVGNNKQRVLRGGSWNNFPTKSRSTIREPYYANAFGIHIGLRVVAVPK